MQKAAAQRVGIISSSIHGRNNGFTARRSQAELRTLFLMVYG